MPNCCASWARKASKPSAKWRNPARRRVVTRHEEQTTRLSGPSSGWIDEVLRMHTEVVYGALKSQHYATLEDLYSDDYMLVRSDGSVLNRQEVVQDLRTNRLTFHAIALCQSKGRIYGPTARNGLEARAHFRLIAVYARGRVNQACARSKHCPARLSPPQGGRKCRSTTCEASYEDWREHVHTGPSGKMRSGRAARAERHVADPGCLPEPGEPCNALLGNPGAIARRLPARRMAYLCGDGPSITVHYTQERRHDGYHSPSPVAAGRAGRPGVSHIVIGAARAARCARTGAPCPAW
jgi:hypothetical protein